MLNPLRALDVKMIFNLFNLLTNLHEVKLSAWDEMDSGRHKQQSVNSGSFQEVRKIEINRKEMEEDWDEDL